ncbi:MAG: hypothetical protein F6K10_42300 [Moorea sp. SIO2B7]|nr:hypothetical protein [Moorena sp. SIO2B7]
MAFSADLTFITPRAPAPHSPRPRPTLPSLSRFPIPDSRFPTPDSRLPIPDN